MGRHVIIPDILQVRTFAPRTAAAAAASWWVVAGKTCVAAYAAKGAVSLAASYVNLANPGTYDCTAPGAAPSFATATGWEFNGSTQYLATGVVPDADFSVLVRFSDGATTGYKAVLGSRTAGQNAGFILIPVYGDNLTRGAQFGATDNISGSGALASGVMGLSGGAEKKTYKDGSADITLTGTFSGTSTNGIFIGAYNYDGTATLAWACKVQEVAIYSDTLDATQHGDLYAAMAAL